MTREEVIQKASIEALGALLGHEYVSYGAYSGENKWRLRFAEQRAAKLAVTYAHALADELTKNGVLRESTT